MFVFSPVRPLNGWPRSGGRASHLPIAMWHFSESLKTSGVAVPRDAREKRAEVRGRVTGWLKRPKKGKKPKSGAKKSDKGESVANSAPPKAESKPRPPRAEEAVAGKRIYEDFDALSEYLTDITGKSQDVVRDFFSKNRDLRRLSSGELPSDPLNVGEAFQEMLKGFSADPGTVMQRQFNLWGDYAKLMATMS